MRRILAEWDAPSIEGLAITSLYFDATKPDVPSDTLAFFEAMESVLPSNLTITVPGTGDEIAPSTGTLTGTWSQAGSGTVPGTGPSGKAASGVGACITWHTLDVVNGHRVKGRTFLVPLESSMYDTDGTLVAGAVTAISAAAAILVGGGLQVWHRPTTVGGSDGSEHAVTSFTLRDKVAYLSSRRD